MRVVSLLPSATEIVCALGVGDCLVGRSAECDYPRGVTDLPIVMRVGTEDASAPSAEIDARVQATRSRGESLYELDFELLGRLDPDVILTQDLCRVCSVTDAEVAAACRAVGIAPEIVTLAPVRLEGVWSTIQEVGRAVGREPEARALVDSLRSRAAPDGDAPILPAPRVMVVEWLDPPILAGLWTPDMIEAAGGVSVGVVPGGGGQRRAWPELAELVPDLVVVSPCSFPVSRTRRELLDARLAEGLARLRPQFGIWLADEAYFSRPGPRLIDGVDLLRSLLRHRPRPMSMPVEPWAAQGVPA